MAARRRDEGHPPAPVIRYAPLGELKVYQVQEHELDRLAAGSPGALHLNFALFFLPIGITLLVTLATTKIESDRLFQAFVLIAATTIIAGLVLLTSWWKSYRSAKSLVEEIKNRMPPPEPIAQPREEGPPRLPLPEP